MHLADETEPLANQLLVPEKVFKKVVEYLRVQSIQLSWNDKLDSVMDFIEEREWESGTA